MTKPIRSLAALIFAVALMACAAAQATPAKASSQPQEKAQMLVIRVQMKIKPDQEEAFVRYLRDESKTVRKLDGCVRYELFKATESAGTYLLYEEWASQADFDKYRTGPLLKKSFEVLGPMMAGPPDSAYYAGDRVGP